MTTGIQCLADPRYDGRTFGVISLLGAAQAKAVERRLLERVAPEDWAARKLQCGDSADFPRHTRTWAGVVSPNPGNNEIRAAHGWRRVSRN